MITFSTDCSLMVVLSFACSRACHAEQLLHLRTAHLLVLEKHRCKGVELFPALRQQLFGGLERVAQNRLHRFIYLASGSLAVGTLSAQLLTEKHIVISL